MDKPDYTPKLQNQSQLDTIYESDFKDIQPYLFRVREERLICFNKKAFVFFFDFDFSNLFDLKVYNSLDGAVNQVSVGSTVKRMFKDALSFN